ncbi:helix-turn-helix domain-containing protein [Virgibacillus dokdonensis]|uniref:helix-turn-helix domain-containing protein n=1 Tax=Virgibacillus dokdonensis TaxID=302167 RepID=UPI0015923941|nr:AraC family transcriptional regulator [Virgibacillus dokdonensis]
MDILVGIHQYSSTTYANDLMHEDIPDNAKTKKISDFKTLLMYTKEKVYDLIVILTKQASLPCNWNLEKIHPESPPSIMIITNFNCNSSILIESFLQSIFGFGFIEEKNSIVKDSLKYISENLCESELSLEKVASKFYLNKSHYSRVFKEKVGVGFKTYVIQKRIEKAKILLQHNYSVTDVCFTIGYNDLTHFSRTFKKIVGISPSEYRRRAR